GREITNALVGQHHDEGMGAGFDHGAGHPRLFLDDAKAPNCRKNNGFGDLGNYSEWPKVAGAVIQAWARVRASRRKKIGRTSRCPVLQTRNACSTDARSL